MLSVKGSKMKHREAPKGEVLFSGEEGQETALWKGSPEEWVIFGNAGKGGGTIRSQR